MGMGGWVGYSGVGKGMGKGLGMWIGNVEGGVGLPSAAATGVMNTSHRDPHSPPKERPLRMHGRIRR